jgi:hypothetical protein
MTTLTSAAVVRSRQLPRGTLGSPSRFHRGVRHPSSMTDRIFGSHCLTAEDVGRLTALFEAPSTTVYPYTAKFYYRRQP